VRQVFVQRLRERADRCAGLPGGDIIPRPSARRGLTALLRIHLRVQIPSPVGFRHESGYWVGPPWWAPVPGADFDLHVSDWEGAPDAESLAYAERVLPRVHDLRAQAARHIAHVVVVRGIPALDPEAASIVAVFCDAGSETVILELNWEADLYSLWWVRFRDHPTLGLRPVEFGCRGWGGDIPRWRAPFRPADG
jgi:hypothetical protein